MYSPELHNFLNVLLSTSLKQCTFGDDYFASTDFVYTAIFPQGVGE